MPLPLPLRPQAYTGIAAAAREHGLYPAVSMYSDGDCVTMLGPKQGLAELQYRESEGTSRLVRTPFCRVFDCVLRPVVCLAVFSFL